MNQEQAKAWLPLIQAVAEGKTLQVRQATITSNYGVMSDPVFSWVDCDLHLLNSRNGDVENFRIKPEPKKQWYRVALLKNREGTFFTLNADSSEPYKEPEKAFIGEYGKDFVGWLTDRIEYELPEGEA